MGSRASHIALANAYDGISTVVADLDDSDLQRPTRCRGWLVADLLFHVLCDAQRALVALASPADGPATVDSVSYWHSFPGGDGSARYAWWARRSAAAFDSPSGVVRLWADTAPAAARAAGKADPAGFVTTQGHVLRVADLLDTFTTEAVVHHLDLVLDLPDAPRPGRPRPGSRWPPWSPCSAAPLPDCPAGTTTTTCSGPPGGCRSVNRSGALSANSPPASQCSAEPVNLG